MIVSQDDWIYMYPASTTKKNIYILDINIMNAIEEAIRHNDFSTFRTLYDELPSLEKRLRSVELVLKYDRPLMLEYMINNKSFQSISGERWLWSRVSKYSAPLVAQYLLNRDDDRKKYYFAALGAVKNGKLQALEQLVDTYGSEILEPGEILCRAAVHRKDYPMLQYLINNAPSGAFILELPVGHFRSTSAEIAINSKDPTMLLFIIKNAPHGLEVLNYVTKNGVSLWDLLKEKGNETLRAAVDDLINSEFESAETSDVLQIWNELILHTDDESSLVSAAMASIHEHDRLLDWYKRRSFHPDERDR